MIGMIVGAICGLFATVVLKTFASVVKEGIIGAFID